ncbi:MAG: FecR family protein [Niabella sp.]
MREKLAILLSRKLSGEATSDELAELEVWIKEHPQDHYFIEILESYWQSHTASDFVNVRDDVHFEQIMNKATVPDYDLPVVRTIRSVKTLPWKKWLTAAAVIGLVFALGLIVSRQKPVSENVPENINIVSTTLGAKSQVLLPDGSKVWLNAASKLHYDKQFNGKLREVYLDGEAYFDVRKDKKRPFIVHTSDIDIRVLGTAFNVKSYKDEPTIEATLIHGSIQVINKLQKNLPKIILNPSEKLVFIKNAASNSDNLMEDAAVANRNNIEKIHAGYLVTKILPAESDSSFAETSWVQNRLLFDGDSFSQLAVKMERWFGVKIHFEDKSVANYRLRGVFEDETIEEALKALQQISSFNYMINDKDVTITK